jgi:nucleoside-diphosphate-sugar epimerase
MSGDDAVLVLGGSGQVGASILKRLGAAGRPAVALCRRPPSDAAYGAEWLASDLTQPLDLRGRRISAAIHASSAWLLPAHLATLSEAGAQRLVCFSSSSMLAKANSPSSAERATAERLAAAEKAVAEGPIAWTVLRPTLIYGFGRDANITAAARFISRWRFFPLAGPGKGLRQPVHADDLGAAAVRLIGENTEAGKAFNIGGGETMTYREMIERIFTVLDMRPRFLRLAALGAVPGRIGAMARRMEQDLVFDQGEVWHRLGLTPRKFLAAGLADLGGS